MRRLDLISGFFWFFFSAITALESYRLHLGSWHRPGSGFLPFIASSFLGVLSIILLLQTSQTKKKIGEEEAWPAAKGWPKAAFLLVVLLGFALGLEKLGFVITTFLLLCLLLKTIEPQPWLKTLLFSFLGSFLSYLLFETWLKAQLPPGLLSGLGF